MKWMKKWSYLLLVTATGILYLTYVDKWQVYAEPLRQAKGWYDGLGQEGLMADGSATDGDDAGDAPGSDGGSPDAPSADEADAPMDGDGSPAGDSLDGNTDSEGDSSDGSGNLAGGVSDGNVNPAGDSSDGNGSLPDGNAADGNEGSAEGQAAGTETVGTSEGEAPEDGSVEDGSGQAQVEYMAVEDDYFADAVFIGDSRTVGMYEYGGLEETAAFYASTGLTVYKIFDSEIVSVPGERRKMTVEEALRQNNFAKIYLMIGINEMGTGTVETFLEKYQEAVDHLQELQPDAVIYLQAIIKVTTERSGQGDYINNEGIEARNEGIAQMADNERIFYLDVNPLICDETGGMVPEYTFDGVHLKAKYIDIWKEYLKSHAVSLPG